LSQYKGQYQFASIYPAPEFLAVRLLLLQKMHRCERIGLKALLDRDRLLFRKDPEPSKDDLDETNLRHEELALIQDILEREPHLFCYLKSPFLIKALYELNLIEMDKLVGERMLRANYRSYRCPWSSKPWQSPKVRIAILPSMIKEFDFGDDFGGLSTSGFKPNDELEKIVNRLKGDILNRTKAFVFQKIKTGKGDTWAPEPAVWEKMWQGIVDKHIAFCTRMERPFVIYPDNAGAVTGDVCPNADLTIILLGKNIYLSIQFHEKKDRYPHVPRMYLDIMDIKYSQAGDEIDEISRIIGSKLEPVLFK
jgi:hypothetical protein